MMKRYLSRNLSLICLTVLSVLKVLCQSHVGPHCENPNASIHTLSSVVKCIHHVQYIKPATLYPRLTTDRRLVNFGTGQPGRSDVLGVGSSKIRPCSFF